MLKGDELHRRLAACEIEAMWTPVQPRTMLAMALEDEGYVGEIRVNAYKARNKYQAIVLATCECRWVQVADHVVFDIGHGEELRTLTGEIVYWLHENNVEGHDDRFWSQPEHVMPSGLWVAGT